LTEDSSSELCGGKVEALMLLISA